MSANPVSQLRVALVVENLDAALAYFRDTLGLPEAFAVAGPDGAQVAILAAGRATLELGNPAQGRFISAVETGGIAGTPVRLAFQVADATRATSALSGAGARVIAPPVRTPWNSLNARLDGPAGLQVTVFEELGAADDESPVLGTALDALGGEAGVLAYTVEQARRHGAAGERPFAALAVRDGRVIGTGVNTVRSDADPTAHGEVAAMRDAARRAGSADLTGTTVYSSCEPCALCRTAAAAAGVSEIVYAAGRELVPPALDPDPQATGRLVDAVTQVLPGLVRRGATELSAAELSAPFQAYRLAT